VIAEPYAVSLRKPGFDWAQQLEKLKLTSRNSFVKARANNGA
jgi:hypothetical protein